MDYLFKKCIFAEQPIDKNGTKGCYALNEYFCEQEPCAFFKNKEQYEFETNSYAGYKVKGVRKK